MQALAEMKELYAYNRWANDLILDAVEDLSASELSRDLGSSFPSIRATIVHLLGAEWVWVARWQGLSPSSAPDEWGDASIGELRAAWREVEDSQEAFLESLGDADLDRIVAYARMSGDTVRSPVRQMLRHVVNHATYHRGQVVTMLRQLGRPAPSTDLITYYRNFAGSPGRS